MAPSRTCLSSKGSIIPCSRAILDIHLSDLIDIPCTPPRPDAC